MQKKTSPMAPSAELLTQAPAATMTSNDHGVVRFGFAANAALRFVFASPFLKAAVDEVRREREERQWGHPIEEIMQTRAALTYALLDLAADARDLLPGR
jgi:hypothetical protein